MLKSIAKKILRNWYYRSGRFYKIPFGVNRSVYFEYDPSMILDIMLGFHEPNTFEACRQIIQKGMTVVDIGANRGYFSVFFSRCVAPSGRVYAFEPMPDNFEALQRTIVKNNCQNVVCQRAAIADKNSPVVIFLAENHLMSSLDALWAGNKHGRIMVDGITLDSFFAEKNHGPDFIKMDIEGGGVYALVGMEETIKKFKPCLLFESHTPAEDKAIGKALSLIDYAVFRVGSSVEIKDLNSDHTDPYGIYGTVVAIPKISKILNHLKPAEFQRFRRGQRPTQ